MTRPLPEPSTSAQRPRNELGLLGLEIADGGAGKETQPLAARPRQRRHEIVARVVRADRHDLDIAILARQGARRVGELRARDIDRHVVRRPKRVEEDAESCRSSRCRTRSAAPASPPDRRSPRPAATGSGARCASDSIRADRRSVRTAPSRPRHRGTCRESPSAAATIRRSPRRGNFPRSARDRRGWRNRRRSRISSASRMPLKAQRASG